MGGRCIFLELCNYACDETTLISRLFNYTPAVIYRGKFVTKKKLTYISGIFSAGVS